MVGNIKHKIIKKEKFGKNTCFWAPIFWETNHNEKNDLA
jgi:hypothetical protein